MIEDVYKMSKLILYNVYTSICKYMHIIHHILTLVYLYMPMPSFSSSAPCTCRDRSPPRKEGRVSYIYMHVCVYIS